MAQDETKPPAPMIAIVMGVSGCGKTTVAQGIAVHFRCPFQEGDALHPKANVDKMRAGTPLDDDDRWPWLEKIAAVIDDWRAKGESGVLTCSALKRIYRDKIIGTRTGVRLVYLKGSKELIAQRIAARHHDYMPTALLDSQFAALQEPTADEHPVTVDIGGSKDETVAKAIAGLDATRA